MSNIKNYIGRASKVLNQNDEIMFYEDEIIEDTTNYCIKNWHVFYAFKKFLAVADGATVNFTLTGHADAVDVLLLENSFSGSEGLISVEILEDVTISNVGTLVTNFNRNRNLAITTSVTTHHTATYTGGTLVSEYIAGGGSGNKNRAGGNVTSINSVALKDLVTYAFEMTNESGVEQDILIKIEFRNGDMT